MDFASLSRLQFPESLINRAFQKRVVAKWSQNLLLEYILYTAAA